jgi:hypothetical protein
VGPAGAPGGQKSRKNGRKPSGHAIYRPHSSHRSSRDSTIVGEPDREAVATHTTQDPPTARRRAECSSLIGELSEDGRVAAMGAAMTARQNSRARHPLARHPLARHRARAIQTRIRASAGPAAGHGAEMEHLEQTEERFGGGIRNSYNSSKFHSFSHPVICNYSKCLN